MLLLLQGVGLTEGPCCWALNPLPSWAETSLPMGCSQPVTQHVADKRQAPSWETHDA